MKESVYNRIKKSIFTYKERFFELVENMMRTINTRRNDVPKSTPSGLGFLWRCLFWRFTWIVFLLIIVLVLMIVLTYNLKGCSSWGIGDINKIEKETSFIVEEIKKISEFTTATYYEEQLLEMEKEGSFWYFMSTTETLAVVIKGTAKVGFNLQKITENDIDVRKDGSLYIKIPKAEILTTTINPSDVNIVYGGRNSDFNDSDITELKNRAESQLREHAITDGILEKATNQGVSELTNLFCALGYDREKIHIIIN